MSKELMELLNKDENRKLVEELVKSGKKESEALVEVASKLGYEVTAEELAKELASSRELDDEELEKVSGGALWFGDDAPDGHEVGCWVTYYGSWDDYDSTVATGYCVKQYDKDFSKDPCGFSYNDR